MPICTHCGHTFKGKFCSECGTPAPATTRTVHSVVATSIQEKAGELNLVCPHCEKQFHYTIAQAATTYPFCCLGCKKDFVPRIVKIRSKKSRQNRSSNRRVFTIRVVDPFGREDLIQFVNAGVQDFELRSGDGVVFSYVNNTLKVVQNLTVNRYYTVSAPQCYIATVVYGASSQEVAILRNYRDSVLVPSPLPNSFVKWYYRLSPVMLRLVGRSEQFQNAARAALSPLVRILRDGDE